MTITTTVPTIEGLRFRNLHSDDFVGMAAVREACREHDQIDDTSSFEGTPSVEDIRQEFAQADPQNVLIVELADCVIGYCSIESWSEGDGTQVYLHMGWLVPAQRGQGIGTAMVNWAEDRIRELAQQQYLNQRIEFGANASSTEIEATALLLDHGYRVGYTMLEMGFDVAHTPATWPLPDGIAVRPVLSEHLRPIAKSVDEAYAIGRFHEGFDANSYAKELAAAKHDPSLWQIAWDLSREEIAGQVLSVISHRKAEVFEVSVRPDWRRRGIARALLARALHALSERDVKVIRLHTNENSKTRAIDLYESVGFRMLKKFPRYRKPIN